MSNSQVGFALIMARQRRQNPGLIDPNLPVHGLHPIKVANLGLAGLKRMHNLLFAYCFLGGDPCIFSYHWLPTLNRIFSFLNMLVKMVDIPRGPNLS